MRNNKLIERAEVYEGIARTLEKGLARGAPSSRSQQRTRERLQRQLDEAKRRAAHLRYAANALDEAE